MTWHIRTAILAFLLALAGMFNLTPAYAQPAHDVTGGCIQAGKAPGMYWPGASPARHFIPAEYVVAIRLPQGTPIKTDENGDYRVITRGALACDAIVLVNPADINPTNGTVSQGFLVGCGNWSMFAPVSVTGYIVTDYPGRDRVLYDPREDDLLDALFIGDAHWLSAARQYSCIGGTWDPNGRVDQRTGLYRPTFVANSSEGYVIEDRVSEYKAITYQATNSNHQGDHVRKTAASLSLIRSCPHDPLLIWKGKIEAGEEDGMPYEVVCEEPQPGERVSATLSAGMLSYESYLMDLQANGQARPVPNGSVYLENLCPRKVDQALVDRQNILIDMDAWYSRKLRLHVAFKGLAGSDILLTNPNPYFASTAFVGGGLVQVGASVGNDHRRFVPFALVIPQYHGGTEFYALAPAGLGFGGGAAYQGGERNDVGWSAGGGYYHSWAAWTDAEGDRWDSLDDTYFTELNLLIHPRGELLGYVDGRAVYEGGARSGSFVIGLHTAVSTRSGLEPGSMMSLAQIKAVLGYQF